MKRYRGNELAPSGVYPDLRRLSLKSMRRAGPLPGTAETDYGRVPTVVFLLVGPRAGALYVVLLPIVGFGLLAWFAGRKAAALVPPAAETTARFLRPPRGSEKRKDDLS